jgi:hypothetical protein
LGGDLGGREDAPTKRCVVGVSHGGTVANPYRG